ncbi:relaxase/mobilization nuclease [Haloferula helveola]|uniref:Relaxase/mobilization nuclease n=1 Tax=Haloferula helveola TaxID=490095 RepID=A0ABN6H9H2_9BACT|nr:relaxase/mobilization nuclease [Haloferula helveola]
MVPRLAAEGSSFHGAFLYYAHDKRARTTARVAWTHTLNLMTDRIEKAWKVMAYTAQHAARLKSAAGRSRTGDRVAKPVISYSLSWHPEQTPDKETMLEAARTSIDKLGLAEHEAVIVAHRDEPQPHVHVIVNRIHPVTGMAANLYRSKRKLQDWAREYQKKEGTSYCPQREENHRKRRQGGKTRYANPVLVEAWTGSRTGEGFVRELESKGYRLTRGRKRLVVVDPYGKSSNPIRDLKAAMGGEFREQVFRDRMADIDPTSLPTPEVIKAGIEADERQRDEERRAREKAIADRMTRQKREHRKQRGALEESHDRRIEGARSDLMVYHRMAEKTEAIGRLRDQLHCPGLVRRIGFALFRSDRKLRQELRELEDRQERSTQRIEESLAAMTRERKQDLDRLQRRQLREFEALVRLSKQRNQPERSGAKEWASPAMGQAFGPDLASRPAPGTR